MLTQFIIGMYSLGSTKADIILVLSCAGLTPAQIDEALTAVQLSLVAAKP